MGKITNRSERIDSVRFMLISAIYIFHCGTAAGRLYPFFNTYHVPAFFMLSGFWALNKAERSMWEFIKSAFRRYLLPWLLWVFFYTIYLSVSEQCAIRETISIFLKYLFAVRGTGIGGMWFIAGFFFVTLAYHTISKLTSRLNLKTNGNWAAVNLLITFLIYFCFRNFLKDADKWIFSLHSVPEYLFYYGFGTVLYNGCLHFTEKRRISPKVKQMTLGILQGLSVIYMVLVYFEMEHYFWGWIEALPGNMLAFLPELATVLFALIANYVVAGFISNKYMAFMGQKTLILCCSEVIVKKLICSFGGLLGLTIAPKNPIESVMFCILAIAVARYTVVPFTEHITEKCGKLLCK